MTIDVARTLSVMAVCAIITFASREIPFLIFRGRRVPKIVEYLGRVLPMAIMCVLVFYCIKDINFQSSSGFLPQIIALAVTIAIHLWKKNTFFSILCGTLCYMHLIQVMACAV